MSITKDNFWVASKGRFTLSVTPEREPDYVSFYKGQISSRYWFTDKGVYRDAHHWGSVLHCDWPLDSLPLGLKFADGPKGPYGKAHGDWVSDGTQYVFVTGYCNWEDLEWQEGCGDWITSMGFPPEEVLKKAKLLIPGRRDD